MTVKYLDQGAYDAYALVPTWGVAQDGDGTSKSLATPATCEIVFTGVPSTGVISVLGQTIAVTWATSAANCANLLATAINASTLTALGPAGIIIKSNIRNHLYARGPANGAPANTCQIMMRQGTSAVNGQIAITHTLNNVSSAATINFDGGVGGVWSYLTNNAGIWPQPLSIGGYGVWSATPPFVGSLNVGDIVKIRTDKEIVFPAGNQSVVITNMGSLAEPVIFEFDDGVEWTYGTSFPKFVISTSSTGNSSVVITHNVNTFAIVKCKRYASDSENSNFKIRQTFGSPTLPSVRLGYGGPMRWEYVDIDCEGLPGVGNGGFAFSNVSSSAGKITEFYDIRIIQPGIQSLGQPLVFTGNGQQNYLRVIGGYWKLRNATSTHIGGLMNFAGSSAQQAYFENFSFIGFVPGSRLFAQTTLSPPITSLVVFRNCDLGGITVRGPSMFQSANYSILPGDRSLVSQTQYGNREFSIEESGKGFYEWNASAGFPVLNATLPDGTTKWSIFAQTAYQTGLMGYFTRIELPRIEKFNSLTDGVRNLTVEFLIESTLAWTKKDLSFNLYYVSPDGMQRVIDTFDINGAAFDSSTADWQNITYNGQTWIKKKIVITADLKGQTPFSIHAKLHTPILNEAQGIFLDPEVTMS